MRDFGQITGRAFFFFFFHRVQHKGETNDEIHNAASFLTWDFFLKKKKDPICVFHLCSGKSESEMIIHFTVVYLEN